MKQDNSVPKLDLAPKLKRPLSLWNPLDYLRLLYWVFYFPQALRWYVDTFGGGYIADEEMTWRKGLFILRENAVQRQLIFQGLILTITIPSLLSLFLEQFGSKISWSGVVLGILCGILTGVASSIASDILTGVASSVAGGVAIGVAVGLISAGIADNLEDGVIRGVAGGVTLGIPTGVCLGVVIVAAFGIAFGIISGIANDVVIGVANTLASIIAIGIVSIIVFIFFPDGTQGSMSNVVLNGVQGGFENNYIAFDNKSNIAFGVASVIAFVVTITRPEYWLINRIINSISLSNKSYLFPHISYFPLSKLTNSLIDWLMKDWETGVENINQLLKYSLQFIPAINSINQAFDKIPQDQVVFRVSQVACNPYDWKIILYISASLELELKSLFWNSFVNFSGFFFIPKSYKQRVKDKFRSDIRLNTPSRATAAGFWYLHEKKSDLAASQAFILVRDLPYGEELFSLTLTLSIFQQADNIEEIASLNVSRFRIPKANLLRPTTWAAINSLLRVVEDIKLIQHSPSRNTKSLAYSRAIGELTEVIDNQEQILAAERALIVYIAQNWKQALERIGKEIGNVAITKPVRNPYVIGNPVTGSLFVGREDILRQLEELWIMGNQLQSVVLYGHRRMGKTSILVNIAQNTGAEIKVINLNLQRLGAVSQGVAEVLIAISDAVAKQLNIESPGDEEFLSLPQRTFERYLEQVIENMTYRGLIIALDEFETIEELIKLGQLDPRFMGFLRGLIQINPAKLAFVFAGLHTLEEMTADYFQPFFASVIPINVGFISEGATRNLLANPIPIPPFIRGGSALGGSHAGKPFVDLKQLPWARGDLDHDFLLDYTPEALDLIYSLTSGQPYLIQLIGFQLVRNYNDRVFEQNKSRDPIFTAEDVEAVVSQNFFQQGRYYFEGVWGQASQGAPAQQEILIALAPYPQGITKDELITQSLDSEQLSAAIDTLKRHDVIAEQEDVYRIIVELFRRWVIMSQ